MPSPSPLHALTPREAVTDALHRAILGLDSNNRTLFASACLTTPEMQWHGGGISVYGWDGISALFERVFSLITTHVVSNIRVVFVDEATARLTAHAVSYHVRPEDRESVEETSFTGWSLYDVELVGEEGVWRIKTWRADVLRTVGDRAIVHG
jgi:hypothetical protein